MVKRAKYQSTAQAKVEALLNSRPTISPDQLYETGAFGGRNLVYDACNRGEIECFRMGKRIFIPTAALRRKLGMADAI